MMRLTLVLGLVILGAVPASIHAEGFDFLQPRKQEYFLRVSRSASYQLLPGDYVEVNVVSNASGQRVRKMLMKKIQVMEISNAPRDFSLITLRMNKREIVTLNTALAQPHTVAALRLVQKQPRVEETAVPDTALPDLDFENGSEVATSQLQ